ncbi:putative mitochondrial ABC transporter [Leptomonas pyrrhocoris]|uniref:Putative mitochondrial ABC transporter n=1 Tax=Leptomonas pyrrhocoris TaxID=157538 RepID=A0A0N0VDJ0_LEPPY|nr:putative mitochondrial ABC transporter [Leptomonas pyrrhocoris]KPA75678.1 putative mitochondrial ABC transporter [Leptomonas pyrrhocoris]|eukprot:XP_015654117.1 putative mitochondrial ABC transporter [Leptomonas pyrrhocoris]
MNPPSFFSFLTRHDAGGAPQGPATPSANTGATATPVIANSTKAAESFSSGRSGNTEPDTAAHFSLPQQRVRAAGSVDPPGGTAGSSSDRPNVLREWCGILYYSCRDLTQMCCRKVRNATAAGLKGAAFEEEDWHFFSDHPMHEGPCGPFARCYRFYTSLATTRTCAWMLPGVRDAPIVVHLAALFVGLEAVQAASFYIRYRRALRTIDVTLAEDDDDDDAEAAEAEAAMEEETDNEHAEGEDGGDHAGRNNEGSAVAVRGAAELSATRTARARLPRGSSRAMRRLCRYWAQIEKAVLRAPRKPAGVPTTATELCSSLGSDDFGAEGGGGGGSAGGHNGSGSGGEGATEEASTGATSDGAKKRFTADGVPHGAEKVLVLSDEHTFPVIHRSYDTIGGVPTPASAALNVDEIAQVWRVLHCLWADTVRYSVNYTEARQLLLSCSVAEVAKLFDEDDARTGDAVLLNLWASVSRPSRPPSTEALLSSSAAEAAVQVDSPLHHPAGDSFSSHGAASPNSAAASPRPVDGRVCVACMSLTWYLSVIREVYEAVVVHQDVHRCAEALEELEEYQRAVYQRGVEAGADFFEAALRYAQSHSGEPDANDDSTTTTTTTTAATANDRRRGGALEEGSSSSARRTMLLPQVVIEGDAAHGVSVQPPVVLLPPSLPVPWVHDATQQHRQQPQPSRLPTSNPLASDFPSTRSLPLPPHRDSSPHVVTLRGASPRACWAELTAALAALLRRRRLMELACVRSLFYYIYTGSAAKIVSFSILALLTGLSSRISALGQAAREGISSNLDAYYRTAVRHHGRGEGSGDNGGGDDGAPVGTRLLALFAFECARLAVNTVLAKTTSEYIALSASQRRNTVKAELYEALTRMPLAFFDLHSYDEVEQIVYYVNDIEGVEVHVHNYLCSLSTSLFAMQHALRQLPLRARVLVGLTVAAALGVKYVGRKVTHWTQAEQRAGGVLPPWLRGHGLDGTVSATAELDAQVEENTESNARQGGVMLRGLDIVAVLPQLRPYGADLSLMRWWTAHTRSCGAAFGATEATTLAEGLMVLPRQLYGKLLPALGGAIMTFADWVLPAVVASYGASMALSSVDALSLSNRLMEAMQCVRDMVHTVVDARRVAGVVLVNAYKANVLEKVLNQRRWEPTTMDFKDYAYDVDERQRLDKGRGGDAASGRAHDVAAEGPPFRSGRGSRGGRHVGSLSQQQQRQQLALAKSLRRASASRPPFRAARLGKRLSYGVAWLVAHAPPFLMLQGAMYVIRGGLRWVGLVGPTARGPSALAGTGIDRKAQLRWLRCGRLRHRRHRHLQHPPRQQPVSSPEDEEGAGIGQRHTSTGGSVSDGNGTEAYDSDAPFRGGRSDVSAPASPAASLNASSSSFTSSASDSDEGDVESDLDSEAAALASATVYAVTVQNLQFYYPTAPTVPVFPRPVTCTFTLQSAEEGPSSSVSSSSVTSPNSPSASSSSSAPQREQLRGRLVCLVGPSGHGKSTLLSLLLGMYTHYGSPSQRGGGDRDDGSDGGRNGAVTPSPPADGTGERKSEALLSSSSDGGSTASFGSPRLADTAAPSFLPPDILLTLRLPYTSHRHSHRKSRNRSSGRGASSADIDCAEEQLPVSAIPRDILRGNLFSFVPQSPVIFTGATIAHNISLENFVSLEQEDVLAEIGQCAAWAHCEYIERFPQGLMTYVADSGTAGWSSPLASAAAGGGGAGGGGGMVRLSGGQAQRLMMARALFHGRRGGTVLVMDEPTASLDREVKLEILAEWRELLAKGIVRGMICATHDADLINVADEVVRLP